MKTVQFSKVAEWQVANGSFVEILINGEMVDELAKDKDERIPKWRFVYKNCGVFHEIENKEWRYIRDAKKEIRACYRKQLKSVTHKKAPDNQGFQLRY